MMTYSALVESRLRRGEPVPPPLNREELLTLLKRWPERAKPFLPPAKELRRLGIVTEPPQPFPVDFRQRFVATFLADAELRAWLAKTLGGAQ